MNRTLICSTNDSFYLHSSVYAVCFFASFFKGNHAVYSNIGYKKRSPLFYGLRQLLFRRDEPGSRPFSLVGKGAVALGLAGKTVESELLTSLLEGQLPHGEEIGKWVDGKRVHRPGFDLTFSVPKSVFLLALMGKDERIVPAIEKATDRVLSQIEQAHAKARVAEKGEVQYLSTGHLVVARFLHELSREGDPQLHTHCVVMNLTLRPDGKWRSLASQIGNYGTSHPHTSMGFIEVVRHHKKYYGLLFRAELAYELRHLGYPIEKTHDGFFEVKGFSEKTLKAFSQRRQDIEALLKERGFQRQSRSHCHTGDPKNQRKLDSR